MRIHGKELIGKEIMKELEGYATISPTTDQWRLITEKQFKIQDLSNKDRIYINKDNEECVTLNVRKGKKVTSFTIIGKNDVRDIIELFEESISLPLLISYSQIVGGSKTINDIKILPM